MLFFHANCHMLYALRGEPELPERVGRAAHLVAEGVAVRIASRLAGYEPFADINGSDLVPLFLDQAPAGLRLFLLGGAAGVAQDAARAIANRWPDVRIVGADSGFFHDEVPDEVLSRILRAQPDVLLLGLGSPLQERLAVDWAGRCPAKVIWTVGGLFDLFAGRRRRAPRWMLRTRLEWAWRLFQEPRRLWRRTFVEPPWLAAAAIAETIIRRRERRL